MSDSEAKENFWSGVAQKIIAGLVLGLVLGYANHQFWEKQEEYKKLSERIDQRIKIYSELSHELFAFIDAHNSASKIYQLMSCDSECLKEKSLLDKEKQSVATNINRLLVRAEVYFPNSNKQVKDVKKSIFISYQDPKVQVNAKHKMYLVFKDTLQYFGNVVKNDLGVTPKE